MGRSVRGRGWLNSRFKHQILSSLCDQCHQRNNLLARRRAGEQIALEIHATLARQHRELIWSAQLPSAVISSPSP